MATSNETYLDIVDTEIPLFAFTTSATLVPAFLASGTQSGYVLSMSSPNAFYIRKGNAGVVATTASMRIPPNTLYHIRYSVGERISVLGDGAGGNVSFTLMR